MFALAAAAVALCACGAQPASSASWNYHDVEYQLAVIDDAPLTDDSIGRYAAALDVADPVCRQDRREVGDLAAGARRVIAEAGLDVSVFEVLTAIPGAVPPSSRPLDCVDLPATLAALVIAGAPTPTTTTTTPATTTTTILVQEYVGRTLDGRTYVIRSDDGTAFLSGVPKDIHDVNQLAGLRDCAALADTARAWADLAGGDDAGRKASVLAQHAVNAFRFVRCKGDPLDGD